MKSKIVFDEGRRKVRFSGIHIWTL